MTCKAHIYLKALATEGHTCIRRFQMCSHYLLDNPRTHDDNDNNVVSGTPLFNYGNNNVVLGTPLCKYSNNNYNNVCCNYSNNLTSRPVGLTMQTTFIIE